MRTILFIILLALILSMAIKHADVMTSGQKGLASEWNKAHVIDGNVECNQHQHLEHVIENRTDWPAGPAAGQVIYRTDLKEFYIFNGTDWEACISPMPHGTYYWSAPGNAFLPTTETNQYTRTDAGIETDAGAIEYFCPVSLPHGAVVTKVIVWGIDNADTWQMRRLQGATANEDQMANATFNNEDATINFATIDNENWSYFIVTGVVADGITAARITFTL